MPIKRGGRAGKLVRILTLEQAPVVGAGGFGIVVRHFIGTDKRSDKTNKRYKCVRYVSKGSKYPGCGI